MIHYFISDLHLTPAQPALSRHLQLWVQQVAAHADSVFILGDLVDVWLGDDDQGAWIDQLRQTFQPLQQRQICCYFLPGNRDFLLGDRFCRLAGWVLLPDPYRLEVGEHRLLLTHGDALCTGDKAYQSFRRQVRNAAWQATVLGRSLAERRQLASGLREASDLANLGKASEIMDVEPAEVSRWMQHYNVNTLVHGHTHRPGRHQHPEGERYVLGDWRVQNGQVSARVLRLDRSGFELLTI